MSDIRGMTQGEIAKEAAKIIQGMYIKIRYRYDVSPQELCYLLPILLSKLPTWPSYQYAINKVCEAVFASSWLGLRDIDDARVFYLLLLTQKECVFFLMHILPNLDFLLVSDQDQRHPSG